MSDLRITADGKSMHLNYYFADNFDSASAQGYDMLFDELHKELDLYNTLEKLVLTTDFINCIPNNVEKFTKLKTFVLDGTRFWNANMERLPTSIEVLDFTRQSNLSPSCIKGMERLVNLKELYLDDVFGIFDDDKNSYSGEALAFIPNLIVVFECGYMLDFTEKSDKRIRNHLENHGLFKGLKFELLEYHSNRIKTKLIANYSAFSPNNGHNKQNNSCAASEISTNTNV